MKLPFTPRALPPLPAPLRWLFAAVLSLISVAMLLMLASFITLTLGAFLLTSTPPGQRWLSSELSALTQDSGYSIDIGRVQALGASQLALSSLTVRSQDAVLVQAQDIVLTPALAGLLHAELRLDLRMRSVTMYELPASVNPQPAPEQPTTASPPLLPDAATLRALLDQLPLRIVAIDGLHIRRLTLADAQGAPSHVLSCSLRAQAEKTADGALLDASLSLTGMQEGATPLDARLRARLNLQEEPAIIIDELGVTSPDLTQSLSAHAALPRTAEDSAPLPLRLHVPLPDGRMIALTARLEQSDTATSISDLAVNGPGIAATGAFSRHENALWQGALDAKIDFAELAKFIPQIDALPLRNTLDLTVSFDGPKLTLAIDRLNHTQADLRDITLTTLPLAGMPSGSRSISLAARESRSASTLAASGQLLYDESGTVWRVEDIKARLAAGKAGALTLTGALTPHSVDLALASDSLRLDRLQGPLAAAALPLRLDALRITATGSMAAPEIAAQTRIAPTRLPKGSPALSIDATARIAGGAATLDATINSKALKTGQISLRTPVTLAFSPFAFALPETGLDAAIALRGNLSAAAGILPVGLTLRGDADLDVRATGNPLSPAMAGRAAVSSGRLRDSSNGIALQDIALKLHFDNDAIVLDSLSARDGKRGKMAAKGRLTLAPAAWPVDVSLTMHDIDPFTRSTAVLSTMPVMDGLFDADLRLSGARNDYLLAGTIGSDKLDITLPATFSSSVPQLNVVEKRKKSASALPGSDALHLDVAVSMPRQIFVRGWGLDAEFGGTLALGGTAASPVAKGSLQSLRGRYEEFGRKFTLARARLDFIGAVPPSPYLDIVAETAVDGITAQVLLSGSASAPKVTFASTPALPQEDVLSRILFGKERASISPTQALQMAQTLQRFSGNGQGLDPLGKLRSGFGLDDLSVDSDEDGGTSVGAGKYISDKVYLQVGGGNKGGEAKVQIELTPHIKAESEVGQDARAGGGVFWEWDY